MHSRIVRTYRFRIPICVEAASALVELKTRRRPRGQGRESQTVNTGGVRASLPSVHTAEMSYKAAPLIEMARSAWRAALRAQRAPVNCKQSRALGLQACKPQREALVQDAADEPAWCSDTCGTLPVHAHVSEICERSPRGDPRRDS